MNMNCIYLVSMLEQILIIIAIYVLSHSSPSLKGIFRGDVLIFSPTAHVPTGVCRVFRWASLGSRLRLLVSLAWRIRAGVTARTLHANAGSRRRMQIQYTGLTRRHARANVSGRRMVAYAVGLRCPADPHSSNPSNAACSSACTAKQRVVVYQEHLLWPRTDRSLLKSVSWASFISCADGLVCSKSITRVMLITPCRS